MAKKKETVEVLKIAKRCNRCGYKMWQDEAGQYHCTNSKCVKYKEPPAGFKSSSEK